MPSKNTWRCQQQHGSKSVPMQTGISHGPNVGWESEILSQACKVESPFPWIPLVDTILRVKNILKTASTSAELWISVIVSSGAKDYKRRTYSRDRDSKIHHDAWFGACTQGVAADEIDGSRRGHMEFTLCCFWHQQERNFGGTWEPWQVVHLKTQELKMQIQFLLLIWWQTNELKNVHLC